MRLNGNTIPYGKARYYQALLRAIKQHRRSRQFALAFSINNCRQYFVVMFKVEDYNQHARPINRRTNARVHAVAPH